MNARDGRPARWWAPSLVDLVFMLWVVIQPIAFHHRLLNSDGDLARHIRSGDIILSEESVPSTDLFSFTSAGEPSIPHEWLSQVFFALAHRLGGLALVACLAGLLIGLVYALLTRFLLRRGVDPLLAYLVAMAAAVGGAAHWLARPHLFTLLGVVLLLQLLEAPPRRRWWPVALLFVLWANLHGGYLFGLALLGIYAVGAFLESRFAASPDPWRDRVRQHLTDLAIAVVASLATPGLLSLPRALLGAVTSSHVVNSTSEYLSPDFHGSTAQIFLWLTLIVIAALALGRTRPALPRLLAVLAIIGLALFARRNIPLMALIAPALIALDRDADWRRLPSFQARRVFARDGFRSSVGWPSGVAAILMLSLGVAHGRVRQIQLVPDQFDPLEFPVRVVHRARADNLTGRLFNQFLWGGYLVYAWPEKPVFIEGGHYGARVTGLYGKVVFRDPGWRLVLRDWNIRYVLVPPTEPVATALLEGKGWSIRDCDRTAVLLELGGEAPAGIPQALDGCRTISPIPAGYRPALIDIDRLLD